MEFPQVNYSTAHSRVRRKYGRASEYICENCDNDARDWAWIHGQDRGDPDSYMPLCKSCHSKYDGFNRNALGAIRSEETRRLMGAKGSQNVHAILNEDAVLVIRCKASCGATNRQLADEYGVHIRTIRDIINNNTWRHI